MKYQPQGSFFTNTGKFGKFVNSIFKKLRGKLHRTKVQGTRHKTQFLYPESCVLCLYNFISNSLSQLVRTVIFLLSGFTNSGCFLPSKKLPGSQCPFLFAS